MSPQAAYQSIWPVSSTKTSWAHEVTILRISIVLHNCLPKTHGICVFFQFLQATERRCPGSFTCCCPARFRIAAMGGVSLRWWTPAPAPVRGGSAVLQAACVGARSETPCRVRNPPWSSPVLTLQRTQPGQCVSCNAPPCHHLIVVMRSERTRVWDGTDLEPLKGRTPCSPSKGPWLPPPTCVWGDSPPPPP